MEADPAEVSKKDEAPPHQAPIVRARRLQSAPAAHDELRSGFNEWSGSVASYGRYAAYAVIAAAWAVHGTKDGLLANLWALRSMIVAVSYLGIQVFLTWWMALLYRQRCEYANENSERWEQEFRSEENINSPWPYTGFIEKLGELIRLLHVVAPLLAGTLLIVSMFFE